VLLVVLGLSNNIPLALDKPGFGSIVDSFPGLKTCLGSDGSVGLGTISWACIVSVKHIVDIFNLFGGIIIFYTLNLCRIGISCRIFYLYTRFPSCIEIANFLVKSFSSLHQVNLFVFAPYVLPLYHLIAPDDLKLS
jgi:hypothetical protein